MRVLAGRNDGKTFVGVDDAGIHGGWNAAAGIHISAGQQPDGALAGGTDEDVA